VASHHLKNLDRAFIAWTTTGLSFESTSPISPRRAGPDKHHEAVIKAIGADWVV